MVMGELSARYALPEIIKALLFSRPLLIRMELPLNDSIMTGCLTAFFIVIGNKYKSLIIIGIQHCFIGHAPRRCRSSGREFRGTKHPAGKFSLCIFYLELYCKCTGLRIGCLPFTFYNSFKRSVRKCIDRNVCLISYLYR